MQTAQTILRQIPGHLHMALGIREKLALDAGVRFKMTGTRAVTTEITYTAGSDLYDIVMWTQRLNRKDFTYSRTVRYEAKQIDSGQMVQVLDLIDRGLIEL